MTLPTKGEVAPDAPAILSEVTIDEDKWFEAREDGLYFRERKHTEKGAKTVTKRLTFGRFEIIGRLVPIDDDQIHGLLVRTGDRELAVSADVATEADVARWLRGKGVRFDYTGKTHLATYFAAASARAVRAYTRNGWQRDGAFVVGETVIRGEGRVMTTDTVVSTFEARGTYEDWRKEVLEPAYAKPGWVFSILVGLSSPLLPVVGASTGTLFLLHHTSSTGKTSALMASASCWGLAHASGCLRSFETTENAIEGLAEGHCHIGLNLDEMKRADIVLVADVVYKLANGCGKSRMKSNQDMHRVRYWLVNTLVSSEKTIEDIFKAAGKEQAAGQVVRAIDINGADLLPEIPREQVKAFEKALKSYYGTAGPELVRRIMAMPDGEAVRMWEEAVRSLYDGKDSRLERAAEAFALMIVTGKIMDIDTAVVNVAWDNFVASGVNEALDDCLGVAQRILDFIEASMNATILPSAKEDDGFEGEGTGEAGQSYSKRDGWYRNDTVWLLPPVEEKLRKGHARLAFYRWAGEHGILMPRRDAASGWTNKVPLVKGPDGKTPMALQFNLDRLRAVVHE